MAIERVEIKAVYPDRYTVDAVGLSTGIVLNDAAFGAMYCHPDHGGGLNIIPEIGSIAYAMVPDAGDKGVIVGYVVDSAAVASETLDENGRPVGYQDQGMSRRGLRQIQEPGDIMLSTSDGNFVAVYKGGVVRVGSTGLCQRVYVPVGNLVRDHWQRYNAISPLGEISWDHAAVTKTDGTVDDTAVVIGYSFKSSAQEDVTAGRHTVELRYGLLTGNTLDSSVDSEHIFGTGKASDGNGLSGSETGVLSCVVYSHDSAATTYTMQISREGDVISLISGNVHVEAKQNVFMEVGGEAKLKFGAGSITANATELRAEVTRLVVDVLRGVLTMNIGELAATLGQVPVSASSGSLQLGPLTITAGGIQVSTPITAGGAIVSSTGIPVVVDTPMGGVTLLQLLAGHTHPVVGGTAAGPSPQLVSIAASRSSTLCG